MEITSQQIQDFLERFKTSYGMDDFVAEKECRKAFASRVGIEFIVNMAYFGCHPVDLMTRFNLGIQFMHDLAEIQKLEKMV